jgi:hypothetical protein
MQLKHGGKHEACSETIPVYLEDAAGCLSLLLYQLHITTWLASQLFSVLSSYLSSESVGLLVRCLCRRCHVDFHLSSGYEMLARLLNLSCFALPS